MSTPTTNIAQVEIAEDWRKLLESELSKPYFKALWDFVEEEYRSGEVFPPQKDIFRAFELCSVENLKVVIIGQDPYHGDGQANGLSFSVAKGVKYPPSLVNIFKEVADSGYSNTPESGDLERWAEQGVLLLNSVLTVRAHSAASHKSKGWEKFTNAVIRSINERKSGVVYMLWGGYAQKKAKCIDKDNSTNRVLTSYHPSPLSAYRGWVDCNHFKLANDYLESIGKEPIKW